MDRQPHTRLVYVYAALFFSGFSSILFQEIWMKKAALIFGHTVHAISVILSVFMLGLAVGSFSARRLLKILRAPFKAYAAIESLVAIFGLTLSLVDWLEAPPTLLFKLAFVLLLFVPTFLMGLTLPLVVHGAHSLAPLGQKYLSRLYGINTLGAAFGGLLGAFFILPAFGVVGSSIFAAGTLLFAAALTSPTWSVLGEKNEGVVPPPSKGSVRMLVAALIAGWVGLSQEIIWTRLLSLIFGPSVYAFGSVLFVYLMGIAVGSWAHSRQRAPSDESAVRWGFAFLALSTLLGMVIFCLIPYAYLSLADLIKVDFAGLRVVEIALTTVILFPMTFVHGYLLPLIVSAVSARAGHESSSVSEVFGWNTFGCILGVSLTSLFLIPSFGILPVLFFLVTIALLVSFMPPWPPPLDKMHYGVLGISAFLSFGIGQAWDRAVLASGIYKYAISEILGGNTSVRLDLGTIDYFKEGVSSTVAVFKTENDLLLSVDGKVDASMYGDLSTQILLSALPVSLVREPREVLVIGLASGVTSGTSLLFEAPNVTTVEIEPAIVAAQAYFKAINHAPLESGRHRLIIDDARHFLRTNETKFDVITSEPSNPWMSGIAPLFTQEFFSMARRSLREKGVMCQWLPIYGMTTDLIFSVVRSFASVFPVVYLFESVEGFDVLLIGANGPIEFSPEKMREHWTPRLEASLRGIQVEDSEDLLGLFLAGPKAIPSFMGAPLNTDDGGYVEYRAPRSLHLRTASENHRRLLEATEGLKPYLPRDLSQKSYLKIRKKVSQRKDKGILDE